MGSSSTVWKTPLFYVEAGNKVVVNCEVKINNLNIATFVFDAALNRFFGVTQSSNFQKYFYEIPGMSFKRLNATKILLDFNNNNMKTQWENNKAILLRNCREITDENVLKKLKTYLSTDANAKHLKWWTASEAGQIGLQVLKAFV
jgi:hypothetical protein